MRERVRDRRFGEMVVVPVTKVRHRAAKELPVVRVDNQVPDPVLDRGIKLRREILQARKSPAIRRVIPCYVIPGTRHIGPDFLRVVLRPSQSAGNAEMIASPLDGKRAADRPVAGRRDGTDIGCSKHYRAGLPVHARHGRRVRGDPCGERGIGFGTKKTVRGGGDRIVGVIGGGAGGKRDFPRKRFRRPLNLTLHTMSHAVCIGLRNPQRLVRRATGNGAGYVGRKGRRLGIPAPDSVIDKTLHRRDAMVIFADCILHDVRHHAAIRRGHGPRHRVGQFAIGNADGVSVNGRAGTDVLPWRGACLGCECRYYRDSQTPQDNQ